MEEYPINTTPTINSLLTSITPDIDLTKLISELDGTATDLVAHQKDALLSRKDLAQKTKDFRKLDDAVKLVEIKSLLKGKGGAKIHCSAIFLLTIP